MPDELAAIMSLSQEHSRTSNEHTLEASRTVATVARELGLMSMASRLETETMRRLDDSRLRVLVLGEINHGKSTLLNAIIGRELLPMGVMPTTSAIVSVRRGQEASILAHRQEQPAIEVGHDSLNEIVRGHVSVAGATRYEIIDPDLELPPTIEIVDTPGFNDLTRFRSMLSAGELAHADVYLLVLDATQALTATEHDLVRRALEAAGGFENSGAQLWIALNRADLMPNASDRESVMARVRHLLLGMGIAPQAMFFCSAKSALRGGVNGESEGGVREVRQRLQALVDERRKILPLRARTEVLMQIRYLQTIADVHARALRLEAEEQSVQLKELHDKIAAVETTLQAERRRLDNRREALRTNAVEILEGLEREILEEILTPIDRLDLQQLTGYLPGAVRELVVERCAAASLTIVQELEIMTKEVMAVQADLAARQIGDARAALRVETAPLFVPSTSLGIDVASIALGILGTVLMSTSHLALGLTMTIAAPVANFGLREKSLRDARNRVREAIPAAVHESFTGTQIVWLSAIDNVAARLGEALTYGHQRLHEALLATLELAAKTVAANGRESALIAAQVRMHVLSRLEREFDLPLVAAS